MSGFFCLLKNRLKNSIDNLKGFLKLNSFYGVRPSHSEKGMRDEEKAILISEFRIKILKKRKAAF